MHFLSSDLRHIDSVLEQVAQQPELGKQLCPLIQLARQKLHDVIEHVQYLEHWKDFGKTSHGGGGSAPPHMLHSRCGDALYSPFSTDDFIEYDMGGGGHDGFIQ